MNVIATPYSLLLLVSAGLVLAFALLAWRRPFRGRTAFILLMFAVAEWCVLSAVELTATDMAVKVACAKLEYIGIGAVSPLWLLFTLAYNGSWTRASRRVVTLLWVIPAITFALALTNEHHGLIWSHIARSTPTGPLIYHHGAWFWLYATYSYSLLFVSSLALLWSIMRTGPAYRGQAVILLAALAAPWLGNLAYLLGKIPVPGLDPTPFAFALSGLLAFVDLFRFRLLDLMPVARATLVESLVDGVLVVDGRGRIADLNPAAQHLLGIVESMSIGRDASMVFAGVPGLQALWDARPRVSGEIPSPVDGQVCLEVRIVPLQGHGEEPAGELLILRDITERKQAEERALLLAHEQTARLQAEEALRVRADVLAQVAHDLKNPLGAVKGLAQLLHRQATGDDWPREPDVVTKLERIDGAATKMARIINELLDVAQLDAGEPLALERHHTDLVALAQHMIAERQSSSAARGIRVEAATPELNGVWDAFRLERVFDNLLDNALKYSAPGGPITVRIRLDGDDAILEVADHGRGIPAVAMPRLFDRFHRAANVGATPGTGLGLVGVRGIVEAHGGTITVYSQEGQGTTVTVRLPRLPAALRRAQPPDAGVDVIGLDPAPLGLGDRAARDTTAISER